MAEIMTKPRTTTNGETNYDVIREELRKDVNSDIAAKKTRNLYMHVFNRLFVDFRQKYYPALSSCSGLPMGFFRKYKSYACEELKRNWRAEIIYVKAITNRLTKLGYAAEDDLKQVWGDIYYATKYPAPSGVMFGGGVRAKGMALMAEKSIQEGIPVGVDWALREEGWGNGFRKEQGIPSLLKYGKALESFVQEIDKVLAGWTKANNSKNNQDHAKDFKKRLAEALKKPAPSLKSIKAYIEAHEKAEGKKPE